MKVSIANLGHHISAAVDSVIHARTKTAARIRVGAMFALTGGIFIVSTTNLAMASSDLNAYSKSVAGKTNSVVDVITYISYIGGAALSALGIVDLKKHVENPTQTPMKNGVAKLGFGGMLLALPALSGVVQGTVKDGNNATYNPWQNKPTIQ